MVSGIMRCMKRLRIFRTDSKDAFVNWKQVGTLPVYVKFRKKTVMERIPIWLQSCGFRWG